MAVSWGMLAAIVASLVLLKILASKSSGHTIGIALGALLLAAVVGSMIVRVRHNPTPGVDVLADASVEAVLAQEVTESNEELWDRLTKSRINLSAGQVEDKATAPMETKEEAKGDTGTEATVAKPDWVENPPKRMGNVYRRVVTSDQYSTVEECHFQLEAKLREAVRERMQTLVDSGADSLHQAPEPDSIGIGLDFIMREICQDEYTETTEASFGEMKRVHVLMEFNPAVETQLRMAWMRHERIHRLRVVGVFVAGTLSLLAGAYGLLQFDTWTRGYYTKRLLLGASAAIIVAVVLLLS
ncbi:MAG: hypothetical protein KDA57_07600 [Planctomycetales bacterium]|nr:hypothetical protein [Planctomycetales bacterium]